MKNKYKILIVVLATVSFLSFKLMDNIITKIGMKEKWLQIETMNFFLDNEWYDADVRFANYPVYLREPQSFTDRNNPKTSVFEGGDYGDVPDWATNIKIYIANNNKIEVTKQLCEYMKAYVESDLFMQQYQQKRLEEKSTEAERKPDQDAIDYFNNFYLKTLKENENELAKLKKKGNKLDDLDRIMLPYYEGQVKKKTLEKQINGDLNARQNLYNFLYPENPSALIKRRLELVLEFAATVDFKATTVQKGRYQIFTNSAYQKKSKQWKALYRAGADATKILTDFIKQWLKDGIKLSSVKMEEPVAEVKNQPTKPAISSPQKPATPVVTNTPKPAETETAMTDDKKQEEPAKDDKSKKTKLVDKAKGLLKKKIF